MWGPPTEASEDPAHPIMHLMDFYLHEVRSLSFPKWCVAPKSSWVEGLTFKAVKPRAWKEPEPAEFANFFSRIQHDIKLGELQKAVSVVFSSSQGGLCSEEIFNALLRLASSPDDLHVYGFWGEDKAIL